MYDVVQIMIGWGWGGGGGGWKGEAQPLSQIQPFTFLYTVEPPLTAKGVTSSHLILLVEEIFFDFITNCSK